MSAVPGRSWRTWGLRALFTFWAAGMLVLCSYLLAGHLLALPLPTAADPALRAALARSRAPQEEGRWLALHFLYARCDCSRRVVEHLLQRPHPEGVAERVIWIEGDKHDEDRARAAGFAVENLSPEALAARYPVQGAPLLVVIDPDGELRYVGGYTTRKQGPTVEDLQIISAARRREAVESLPLFGCAVSKGLQEALNPLQRLARQDQGE
jgi:hypothetical protein